MTPKVQQAVTHGKEAAIAVTGGSITVGGTLDIVNVTVAIVVGLLTSLYLIVKIRNEWKR